MLTWPTGWTDSWPREEPMPIARRLLRQRQPEARWHSPALPRVRAVHGPVPRDGRLETAGRTVRAAQSLRAGQGQGGCRPLRRARLAASDGMSYQPPQMTITPANAVGWKQRRAPTPQTSEARNRGAIRLPLAAAPRRFRVQSRGLRGRLSRANGADGSAGRTARPAGLGGGGGVDNEISD